MAHVEDRWYQSKRNEDGSVIVDKRGKPILEPTERHGKGKRYRVRYLNPAGMERSRSFPDRQRRQAEDFLISIESDKARGEYVDPSAGKTNFKEYAESILPARIIDESTRETIEQHFRKHVYPYFGDMPLVSIAPENIREWDQGLVKKLASSTRSVIFAHVRTILSAAVDDEKIRKSPFSARSVQQPRPVERKVVPWKVSEVLAIRNGLHERYRPMTDIGAGCGLRQGEIFGLGLEDIDFEGGWIHIQRQVKRVRSRLVFGLPKNDRDRKVPLSATVADTLRSHVENSKTAPVKISLPWENPASEKRVTAELIFTSTRGQAINRVAFNRISWHPALASAGIERDRSTGMHALRHFYASALLDAGENIRALSVYLGHHDPGYTLRTYTHLMPASEERTRRAIDKILAAVA